MAWSKARLTTVAFWAVTALVALAVGAGGFWIGAGGLAVGSSSSAPVPSATPTLTPVTSLAPGTYEWDALLAGACLADYASAWELEYEVVPCTTAHAAQVIRVGQVPGYAAAAYPGESTVSSAVLPLCTELGLLDPAAAAANPTVVTTFSFPVSASTWTASKGLFTCFASTSDGVPLVGSLLPSPTP